MTGLTFHFGHAVLLVMLLADGHVSEGGADGVSRAVVVRGVVHVLHGWSLVGLRESKTNNDQEDQDGS